MAHPNPDPPSHLLEPKIDLLRVWLWPDRGQIGIEHVPAHALIGGKVGRLPDLVALID